MDTNLERSLLVDRAWDRNTAAWVSLDGAGYGTSVAALETALITLGQVTLQQYLHVVDTDADLEADWRDRLFAVELKGLEAEQRIALANFEADRQVLAMKIAGQNYILAAREYDLRVQDQLMTAREFAAAQEYTRLELEKSRAEMAVRREEARLKEIEAKLLLEKYEQAKVDVEISRTQVQVAKTQVQAVLADIAVEEAKLDVIEAQLQIAMAEADKATLQADVATILADIIVKGLTEIKYYVESAELEAGFGYIASELADMLSVWNSRVLVEQLKRDAELAMIPEVEAETAAKMALVGVALTEMDAKEEVWNYEKDIMETQKVEEEGWRNQVHELRDSYATAKSLGSRKIDNRTLWGKLLMNTAKRWTYKNYMNLSVGDVHYSTKIYKGFLAGNPSFPSVFGGETSAGCG